jgi:hypothetical protein
MLLGKFNTASELRITIVLNARRSAPNARYVKIHSAFSNYFEDLIAAQPFECSIPAYITTVNAPVIYLRPDTIDKFSDIPLLTTRFLTKRKTSNEFATRPFSPTKTAALSPTR